MCLSGVRTSTRLQENTTTTTNTITIATFSNTVERSAGRYISLPYAPSYLTSLRVLTLSIPRLFLSLSLFLGYTSRFQRRAYAPINVPRSHTRFTRVRAHLCVRTYAYVVGCAQRTHSDRRDYEVGLRGEHISFLVIINAAKNVAKTCSAFGKYIPRSVPSSGGRLLRSLSLSIRSFYSRILSLPPSSLQPRCPFPFCPVAPHFFLRLSSCLVFLFLFSITVGVARQPVHRGQANFLPAVILFRPSRSLRPGLTRPLRQSPRTSTNSSSSSSSRRYLSPSLAAPRRPLFFVRASSSRLSVTCSSSRERLPTSLVLLLFPRLSYLPLPARNDATLYQFPRR